jgi:hypothetical protein
LQFVTNGGRLVIGGVALAPYIRGLRDRPPAASLSGARHWTVGANRVPGVRSIETVGTGSWSAPGDGRVLVGAAERALLVEESVGRGEIAYLADTTPLMNGLLARADNAALGLSLAGGRNVVFAEGVHGYGRTRGWRAIPSRWKVALTLIALAALAFVWGRALRFGPPDRRARELPPARAEYVRALSLTLERTRDRTGALTPAQRWARDRVASRAALGAEYDDEALARAARGLGCTDEEIAALIGPPVDDDHVMALGRAVARVAGDDRRAM